VEGSALIREVVEHSGLAPPPTKPTADAGPVDGRYGLDGFEAVVARDSVTEIEGDPLTGVPVERRYPLSSDATLMTWRSDFPRPDVARIGWVALPRAGN
jgi:hypothetical protein